MCVCVRVYFDSVEKQITTLGDCQFLDFTIIRMLNSWKMSR